MNEERKKALMRACEMILRLWTHASNDQRQVIDRIYFRLLAQLGGME